MSASPQIIHKIAVAEDNLDLQRALVGLLRELGHQVVEFAADGAELLRICARQQVDLVVTDLDMPHIDGLEAAEELSQRGVPVILVSGHADAASVRVEHKALAGRLLKPVTQTALRRAIQCAMRSAD